MKKAITILAILAIVVGAVFAETHSLTVSTTVAEVVPCFQLRYGADGVHTNATADTNSINAKTYANVWTANGQYGDLSAQGAIDLNQDIAVDDVTADFYAVLAIGGKQTNKTYSLSFSAGSFDTKHNTILEATACSQSSLNNIVLNTHPTVVTSNATTGNDLEDGATQDCTITMVGAAAEEKIDLVKFSALWPRKPNADAGTYTANVTLTITVDAQPQQNPQNP